MQDLGGRSIDARLARLVGHVARGVLRVGEGGGARAARAPLVEAVGAVVPDELEEHLGVPLDVLRTLDDLPLEDQRLGRVDPDVRQVLQVREQQLELVTWEGAHRGAGGEGAVEDEVVGGVPPAGGLARGADAEPLVAAGRVVGGRLLLWELDRRGRLLPAQVRDQGHLGLGSGLDGAAGDHPVPGVDGRSPDVVAFRLPEPLRLAQAPDS